MSDWTIDWPDGGVPPDVSNVIAEIMNRPGWAAGDTIMIHTGYDHELPEPEWNPCVWQGHLWDGETISFDVYEFPDGMPMVIHRNGETILTDVEISR
ncbi:hypothetical protein [Kribbella deserti]|uniref:Uncharacterized protein n=1 Tax=Kribbella deserti TaxID=1926257 RepID=A0ABV6QQ83_9ACTN